MITLEDRNHRVTLRPTKFGVFKGNTDTQIGLVEEVEAGEWTAWISHPECRHVFVQVPPLLKRFSSSAEAIGALVAMTPERAHAHKEGHTGRVWKWPKNQHPVGSELYEAWNAGWKEADDELKEKAYFEAIQ
jgi:hypothetical protein